MRKGKKWTATWQEKLFFKKKVMLFTERNKF